MLEFTDDIDGTIIGGDYVTGQLCYETRPQGRQLYADDAAGLRIEAGNLLRQIKADCGRVFADIYPHDEWTLRIHGNE